jgi:hypothetical protein
MLATVASLVLPLAQDAAEEGKKIITAMLIVGLIFLGVILVGEGLRIMGHRRKQRARARAGQPPPYRRV